MPVLAAIVIACRRSADDLRAEELLPGARAAKDGWQQPADCWSIRAWSGIERIDRHGAVFADGCRSGGCVSRAAGREAIAVSVSLVVVQINDVSAISIPREDLAGLGKRWRSRSATKGNTLLNASPSDRGASPVPTAEAVCWRGAAIFGTSRGELSGEPRPAGVNAAHSPARGIVARQVLPRSRRMSPSMLPQERGSARDPTRQSDGHGLRARVD